MKAINLFRAVVLITVIITAASFTSYAKKPVTTTPPTTAASINTTLATCLKFPDNVDKCDYEGTVDVIFLIEDGKMIVEKAYSSNSDLATYVREQLGKVCCKHIRSLTNQHYAVRLTFTLLDQ